MNYDQVMEVKTMANKCRTIAIINLICGIVSSIYLAYKLGVEVDIDYRGDLDYDRNWLLTMCIFAGGCFATYMIFVIFVSIAEILDNTSLITSIESTTNSTLNKLENEGRKDDLKKNNGWRCPGCNKINPDYIETCSCGEGKRP